MNPSNLPEVFETLKVSITAANTEQLQADVHAKILELMSNGLSIVEIAEGVGLKVETTMVAGRPNRTVNLREGLDAMFPVKFRKILKTRKGWGQNSGSRKKKARYENDVSINPPSDEDMEEMAAFDATTLF